MAAFNAVRFKIKPGRDRDFLDAHRNVHRDWPGLKHASIIKTGEHTYCLIAEWSDVEAIWTTIQRHARATLKQAA